MDEEGFDRYDAIKREGISLCFFITYLPSWILEGDDFVSIIEDESKVPEIYKENFRFLIRTAKVMGI